MIGGKVLDPSAFVARIRGNLAMQAWLDTAAQKGIVPYLPDTSLTEVLAIYRYDSPAEQRLGELRNHPCAVRGTLDRFDAEQVARLLDKARMWDVTAGHVILVVRQRGWPVLTADPGRIQRIAPDLDLDLL